MTRSRDRQRVIKALATGCQTTQFIHQGDLAAPATWDASIALGLSGVQWKDYRAETLEASARIDPESGQPEMLEVRLEHAAAALVATATASFAEVAAPADLFGMREEHALPARSATALQAGGVNYEREWFSGIIRL